MGATLVFPKTKATSVVWPVAVATFLRRKATALGAIAEHMKLQRFNSLFEVAPWDLNFAQSWPLFAPFVELGYDSVRQIIIPLLTTYSADVFQQESYLTVYGS